MRRATIGLLAVTVSIAAGACDRGDVTAAGNKVTGRPRATAPAPVELARPTGSDAIGTSGSSAGAAARRVPLREVIIPAGTRLPIVLDTPVASNTSRIEERVQAHLARPVMVHGATAVPQGSRVSGIVTDATQAGRVKGRAHVALRFDTLEPGGVSERYRIETTAVGRTAPGTKKKDAMEIGAPAAGGAIIGGLLGGKKGALIGSAAGGGGGTAVVLATRGKEVRLPKGAAFTIQLSRPITVKVRG
jgi:hypothetical protein